MPEVNRTSKKYFERRKSSMKLERESFDGHWKELAQFVQPRRGRFFVSDRNKGDKRHNFIINNKASQAHKIARAGLFAGVMSPTRPWFKLSTPDQGLMKFDPVVLWLHQVEEQMRRIFNESNLYNMAPVMLAELLLFGIGLMSHVDDDETVARFYTHTIGSYWLAQDDRFNINTVCREMQMTVEQVVTQFGLENTSVRVKDLWDKGNYDSWIDVTHFIDPNPDVNPNGVLATSKPFRSTWYERGIQSASNVPVEEDQFLKKSGFDEFPMYAPRWDVTGEDIYATDCPGMTSLGDIKGLQIEEKRKAQAIDKMVNPPLVGPASFRNVPITSLPGGVNIAEVVQGSETLRPVYTVNPQLGDLKEDINAIERRIDQAFFVDMFLAISNMEGIQPRNQLELAKRDGERLLQLGPVLERVHGDFLTKLIDRTFNQMIRNNLLPPIPEELQNTPLKVDFISTLAQAQRAVATGSIEQLAAFISGIAPIWEDAADKFDADEAIDKYADLIGVPPSIITGDEEVQAIREQRAQQQQAQLSAQLAESATKSAAQAGQAAASAGQTNLSEDNLVSRFADANPLPQ